MEKVSFLLVGLILGAATLVAQEEKQKSPPPPKPPEEYSGMYSFLRDGEFLQLTIEDQGRVTGFVSRFGEAESDKGAFLDQFFKAGKIEGNKLSFTTQTVHGVWFDFKGTVERGQGKNPGDEAYYLLKGTLTEHSTDQNKKTSARSREAVFKQFPQDMSPAPPPKD